MTQVPTLFYQCSNQIVHATIWFKSAPRHDGSTKNCYIDFIVSNKETAQELLEEVLKHKPEHVKATWFRIEVVTPHLYPNQGGHKVMLVHREGKS